MGSQPRGISASRGAAILGFSQYQTPLAVFQLLEEEQEPGWNAAHGYTLPEREETAAMRWGTAFESAVIELAERAQRERIINREGAYSYNLKGIGDFITCHIDGAYDTEAGEGYPLKLHEGKTVSARSFFRNVKDYENSTAFDMWGEPGTDKIPRPYQIQVQHQMLCTGAEQCILSALIFPEMPDAWEKMGWMIKQEKGNRHLPDGYYLYKDGMNGVVSPLDWATVFDQCGFFHQYPVSANAEAQKALAEKYREFWENHVLAGKPPEPRNFDDVKRLVSVQEAYMDKNYKGNLIEFFADMPAWMSGRVNIEDLWKNDGFRSRESFEDWFIKYPTGEMAILHFTDYRY